MFNYYNIFSYFSLITSIFTCALFFLRFFIFYKKGIEFAVNNKTLPKLPDIHFIFLIIGILVPFILSFIPFLNLVVVILSFFAFLKLLPEVSRLENPSRLQPEKIAFMGGGFGIGGFCGFLLGFYRGSSYTDEKDIKQISNQ